MISRKHVRWSQESQVDGLLVGDALARGHASKVATGYRPLVLWSAACDYAPMSKNKPCLRCTYATFTSTLR